MSRKRRFGWWLPSLTLILGGLFFGVLGWPAVGWPAVGWPAGGWPAGAGGQSVAASSVGSSLGRGFLSLVSRVDGWVVGVGREGQASYAQAATVPVLPVESGAGLPIPMIMGYYDDAGNTDQGMQELQRYGGLLTGIVPFWYTIYANGSIGGRSNARVLSFAAKRHLYVFALVQNMAGYPVFHPLLNDPAASQRAIQGLLNLVQANGYSGVNLDFEGIGPKDRAAFSDFVAKLAAVLHQHGYYLTLSIPAKTQDEPDNGWAGAYDYHTLGQYADLVMIMAYDEHSQDSAPGPIASRQWVEAVVSYAVTQISPSKIVLGIPAYGYSWAPSGVAKALSYWQAANLAHTYGANPNNGYLRYYQGGVWHQVWYEDEQTFLQKVGVVTDFDLRGIVLWRLGIEDPTIWQTIDP